MAAIALGLGPNRPVFTRVGWAFVALLSVIVALFSYRYLVGVGPLAPNVIANAFARPWLLVHVAGAATALLVGPFQFLTGLRRRVPKAHRWSGRAYVAGVAAGSLGGFVMAFGATTGPITTLGFGTLAVVWLFVTARGFQLALQRRIAEHRRWMIRSFLLTFASVVQRIYLVIAGVIGLPFEQSYPLISILCWLPNLILLEVHFRISDRRSTPHAL